MTKTREISDILTGVTIDGAVKTNGGTYAGGTDTVTNAGVVIDEEDFIYTQDGGYLRKLIGKTSDSIQVGQSGTSLISSINFLPGTAGNSAVNINGNTIWNAGNDGAGSGLDADTVDGLQASQFLRSDVADTAVKLTFGTGNVQGPTPTDATTGARLNLYPTGNGSDYSIGIESNSMWFNSDFNYKWYVDGSLKFEWDNTVGQFEIGGNKVWNAGNDGSGSGLDADTVDGIQGSSFLRSDANDTMTGILSIAPTSGYGSIEMGGPSGGYIDFKAPHGDDYDGRIIYNGSNFAVTTNLNQPVVLQHNNSTKLSTSTTGISITGDMTASGNVTAYSDERLKSDIETLDGSKVYEMRGVSFTKDGEASSGVIAQELQKVAPELVDDRGEYLSVAYGNLVGYLIEAVKELKAEVEQLKSEK